MKKENWNAEEYAKRLELRNAIFRKAVEYYKKNKKLPNQKEMEKTLLQDRELRELSSDLKYLQRFVRNAVTEDKKFIKDLLVPLFENKPQAGISIYDLAKANPDKSPLLYEKTKKAEAKQREWKRSDKPKAKGKMRFWKMVNRIIRVLAKSPKALSENEICEAVCNKPIIEKGRIVSEFKKAFQWVVEEEQGCRRTGKGVDGNPFRYELKRDRNMEPHRFLLEFAYYMRKISPILVPIIRMALTPLLGIKPVPKIFLEGN